MSGEENDLPLLSNINRVRARHYIWCAYPVLESRGLFGQVIIVFSAPTALELPDRRCSRCPTGAASESDMRPQCCHVTDCGECEGESKIPVVLDMKDLIIRSVSSVACSAQDLENYVDPNCVKNNSSASKKLFSFKRDRLEITVEPWSLKFECAKEFPFAIFIEYNTTEKSDSLSWKVEAGNICFFTSGSAINNRALLPYQDAPAALATWEAFISIDDSFHVSMSGDEPGFVVGLGSETYSEGALDANEQHQSIVTQCSERCYYFYSSLPIPLATLAIAAGVWSVENVILSSSLKERCSEKEDVLHSSKKTSEAVGAEHVGSLKKCAHKVECGHSPFPCLIEKKLKLECELQDCAGNILQVQGLSEHPSNNSNLPPDGISSHARGDTKATWSIARMIPTTLVYSSSLEGRLKPLREFLPHCLSAAGELLGPHPCPRLEVVVMPPSYASLGLASPNLIFLAPCVATAGDFSTFLRIAHEISHAWFGIIIGAVDWTEEWLSEGFAAFAEELICERAIVSYRKALCRRKYEHAGLRARHFSHEELDGSCGDDVLASCPSSESIDNVGSINAVQCGNTLNMCETRNDLINNSTEQIIMNKHWTDAHLSTETNVIMYAKKPPNVQKDATSELLSSVQPTEILYTSLSRSLKRQKMNDRSAPTAAAAYPDCEFSSSEKMVLSADEGIREELLAIRDHLRYRKLIQEIQVTDADLQTLLPNSANYTESSKYVANGLQKDKPFLNAHYIKGFFFLKYLSGQVGKLNFCSFLKKFVLKFHGLLITSRNFLDFFCTEFPDFSVSKSELALEWLQSPGVGEQLKRMNDSTSLGASLSKAHYTFWTNLNSRKNAGNYLFHRSSILKEIAPLFHPDRIQLYLEYMLEYQGHFSKRIMRAVGQFYDLEHQNSDVRHVWCELVIKHDYRPGSRALEKFLTSDQAMGIYLYGELMISRSPFWQALAKRMYRLLKDNMDDSTKTSIYEMLYPQ